ncbi:centromere protein F [Hydra vulgaris]|uniref:centromere protein F n=1 Tax=Hydra vulgaris TaxID=6087 RepID=UPI001F5FDD0D|nr:centromere protein F [Hydra vulgaris]
MACRNLESNLPNYSEYSGTQPTVSRKVHFNDKQSENCFHYELFPECHSKDDNHIFLSNQIKFNDAYTNDKDIKDVVETIPQIENKHLDVQSITLKLKQSYDNIDREQDLLKKISQELNLSKSKLMCHQCAVYNKDTAREVDRLLKEVECLQNHFQSVAKRKKKYLEELSLLQVALHRDRTQMEASFQESPDSKQILKTKLDESSKVTRDQRKMIYKLKSDNIALWKLLQEVQEHLRNEHHKGNDFINEFQASSGNKQLSDIPTKREVDIYKNMYTDAVTSSASSSSLDIFQDGRVSNSSSSSNENCLSEKIRHLIAQTEHIKQVIPNIENHQHEFVETSRLWGAGLGLRECRIPSENEKGMRSDMNDIMSRCEDLEKKVDQCSTKDIREILIHQLQEIDQESSTSNSSKDSSWKRRSDPTCIWNPEQHQRAREDILQCLDKIALLERNFNGTQEEVRRLRNYIKETAEEKEFCEKTYKREAMDLRKVVENKSEEIEKLKEELNSSQKIAVENQKLKAKIEKLEKKLQQKNEEIAKLVHKENETRFLKALVEEKNEELEKLKLEMQAALDRMERFRLQEEIIEDSNNALKSDMKILQERNDELRASIEENIQEELALLQSAILEAERRMDRMKEENNTLKEKTIAAEASSKGGKSQFDIDNVVLVNRLKRYEEELQKVNEELHAKILAENENEILLNKKDSQIRVLTDSLNVLKEDILKGSKTESKSSSDIEFLIAQLMTENKRLVEELNNKDMIIDDFRNAFVNVAAEWDQRVTFETNDSFKENIRKEFNFDTALTGIKESLKKSHYELVDKVAALHKELKEMKEENRTLKKQKEFSTKESRLIVRFEKLNEENSKLRNLIGCQNVDEVKSALCQENDRLFNENSLLRTALNEDRKELVDSNLRKRDKIKLLEQELKDTRKVLKLNLKQTNEDLNFSRDIYLNNSSERILNQSKESKLEQNAIVKEPSGLPPKSKKRSAKQSSSQTSSNEKAAFAEMIQQNEIIRKLQEDNERLRMNATTNKEDKKEIEVLKSEREKLKLVIRSNEAFEEEVNELKNLLKEKNRELLRSKEIISGYEKEITFLRDYNEGLTPTASPDGKRSSFKKTEKETLLLENAALKSDLDKALKDIEKLIEIVDRRKLSLSNPLNKKSVSCNDITILDHESKNIQKNKNFNYSLDNSMTEINSLKQELIESETSRNKAYDEIGKLKATLQSFRNEKDKRDFVEDERKQKQIIEELKNSLEEAMREKRKIISQNLQDKITLEEKINSMVKEINKLKEEKLILEADNNIKRVEYTEKNDDGNDWFQSDLKKRFSLLSPDDQRGNLSDRKHARDHGRLIRKLQVENQTLRAKMLTLEEEGVETIKIIADMERGHGHLTGTLRTHLVLQKASTAKLLESSIEQYAADFENFKRKFKSLETKYDRDKKSSKRRDHAWDFFTNASASITNIHNILNEGFFKFEEDLEKDLDEDFVNKDYKSRLWIMRRQLSDVEKRHRELQLRAEELNIRLHAKTAEYEVTQEELEDTTRDLESRDSILHRLKKDALRLSKENQSLSRVIKILQENEEKTIKEVIMHNTVLQSEINELSESHDNRLRDVHANILELSESLEEKQKSLSEAIRLRDLAKKETEECLRRIQYLEKKLHEMTEQRDKLKKEAENRAGYMAKANEDHGTIHLLRDDLKKLAKENADMKQELSIKQRLMYDMSKDLHTLRLKEDGKVSERKMFKKEDEIAQLQHEISELKTEKFILETKVKDLERKRDKPFSKEDKFLEKAYRNKLVEKEAEIQEIKNELTFIKSNQEKKQITNKNLLDQGDDSNELFISYKKLQQQLKEFEEKRDIEIKALTKDIHQKRRRISELLKSIEELKQAKSPNVNEIEKLVENIEIEEQQSLLLEIDAKERETEEWKKKTHYLESELRQARSVLSASSCEDDKFKKVYLNKMLPYSGSVLSGGYFDRKTPGQDSLSLMSKTPEDEDIYHKQEDYEPKESNYDSKVINKLLNRTKSNENIKKTSKIPQRRLPAPKTLNTKLRHIPSKASEKTETCEDNGNDDDLEISFDKVNNFLHGGPKVYRNTLGTTEQNYTYDENAFSRLQRDIDKLTNENTMLKVNLSELKKSLKKSVSGTPKVVTEKNVLLIEENKSLKDLLETQTQNVSSQERVIKSLKSDMENCKSKYIEHCDRISEELKEKKREVRNLKKNVKELQILNSKVAVNGSCNESLNQNKNISSSFGEQSKVEELEKKLKETETTYEDVLKQAEKALEDAKHKLTVQHKQNKELTKKVNEIQVDNQLKETYFEELKTELTETLAEKNSYISSLNKEYQDYKRRSEEEYDKISKQLRELEKQCQDYKILLENSESTTSEFVNHSKYEAVHINDEVNGAKDIESLKPKYSKPRGKHESLVNTLDMISDDRSIKTDIDDKNYENRKIDYEIEYEILKGCNEELEEQIFNLENKLKENEKYIQCAENAINEAKMEGASALMKLQQALNQTDTLEDQKQRLEQKVRELEKRELEKNGIYNFALQKQSLENTEQIEQLKSIVDEYEVEMHRSDTMLKKEKSINKKSIEEFKEVIKSFEEKLNKKNKEIEMLKDQNEGKNTQLKLNDLKKKLEEKQKQLNEKDKEISDLESQLQKWILKSISESYDDPKTLLEQSNNILDMSNDSEEFKNSFTKNFNVNVDNELNNLRKKNSALQLELNDKCREIDLCMERFNNKQEELQSVLKMKEKLTNEIYKKESYIQKLNNLLKHSGISNENSKSFQEVVSSFSEEYKENVPTQVLENEENFSSETSKLSDTRNKNKMLIVKLYKVEQENMTFKALSRQYKEQSTELKDELLVAREKINQLRSLIYENSTDDSNLKIKSKLLIAFEELREKSIEIAELNLKLEIQSQELDNHKSCGFAQTFEEKNTKLNRSTKVESEVDDQELVDQNIQLRSQLISKSQHCDFLQDQIFKLVSKVKSIEKNLLHENEYLKEKYIFNKNIPEQTDVTEVTPLGNTFTLLSKKAKDDANETILLDGFEEYKNEENDSQKEKISNLQNLITQNDYEKSCLKEENNELKLEINKLMKEIEVLYKDIEQQRQKLSKGNENIKEREEAIKCLQTQLLKANNKALKLENEIRQINKEKQSLLEQLEIQKRRYNDDIMNTKSTFLQVKEEHINSLKEELASTIEEKLKLQVILKEQQLDLNQKEELANKLTKENKKIDFNLKMKEEEMDELVNALSLLEAENIRLVDCLNMRVH